MNLELQVLTQTDQLQQLIPEWNDLLPRTQAHFFQTPSFILSWWKSLGKGELHCLVLRQQGRLVGLIPAFIDESTSQLKLIGCVEVADYLDFIFDDQFAKEGRALVKEHFESLLQSQEITEIMLCSVPDTSPTRQLFTNEQNWKVTENQQAVCPQIQLPTSWDEYLAQLDRKNRHEIRRKWRKLEQVDQHRFFQISQPEELPDAFDNFTRLHQLSSVNKAEFWTAEHRDFFKELLSSTLSVGWLRLYFLEINQEVVASMLGFVYGQRFYLYNSGYNPQVYPEISTGSILTAHTIQAAIGEGLAVYDFLRGDEPYKFRFGATSEPVWDITISR